MIPGGRGSYTPRVTPRPTASAAPAFCVLVAIVSLLAVPAAARTPTGTVLVRSTTVGAEVWIDDQLIGEVPTDAHETCDPEASTLNAEGRQALADSIFQ